ncbi:MBL fold metallo-hydrolase [Hoyosella altamirensis]|uniref:Glyoxylase-like metal-dependent hydrolase (Beta-lactamase superfamily II) n=1 Tax=Hoyosella altamirensis TaxID=616997 RepID=A0A839RRE9_9ACTN|nr:MBL fold metallo-hydrolase [Hoyosella altamirensis]MBB3038533.1 glyoxylase-like metal-dependent hydrolase (beta-lactamase superfamily II) [Hoyosella altamirensis]
MKKIRSDLWETEPEYPAPGLSTHAYLWTPPEGNILFYNTTHAHELDHIAQLGGVRHHYLSHQDEIAPSLRIIKERFGSQLHIHRAEAHLAAEKAPVDDPFSDRHTVDSILEIIPTPGHTPGSTCYLAKGAEGTYLFTGDTIYRGADGRWFAGYIKGFSDAVALAQTLSVLASLAPDVVVSSAFAGDSGVTELGDAQWADIARGVQERLVNHTRRSEES